MITLLLTVLLVVLTFVICSMAKVVLYSVP